MGAGLRARPTQGAHRPYAENDGPETLLAPMGETDISNRKTNRTCDGEIR